MSNQPVYKALADTFAQEGVDTCFALLGDANMVWANALASTGCQLISVRHEHCAVAAAMSWSRLTGRTGVATVTCGPGLTQILTALPAASRARIPLVIFAGEAPLASRWYNQAIDQRPFVEATGALYRQLHSIDRISADVRDAFADAIALAQPIVLGVPMDLQQHNIEQSSANLTNTRKTVTSDGLPAIPDEEKVADIAHRICNAKRVIIMAGRGVLLSNATEACMRLADQTHALLATTLPARGLFRDHPFNIGIAGGFSTALARKLLPQSDCIVAIGTRLAQHNSDGGKLFSAEQVIHIDLEPRAASQGRTASTQQLRCDAKLAVEALVSHIDQRHITTPGESAASNAKESWRSEKLAFDIRTLPADSAEFVIEKGLLDPRRVVSALDALLPEAWTTVNSSGHCSYFFAQMPRRPAEHFVTIREFGAIGNGISFAIGAALARPEHPVVLFDGDGSLLMHIQELETIVRFKLNILICVMNDGAYGSEIHKLRSLGLSETGAQFGRRDFAKLANGFDAKGVIFTELDSLQTELNNFINNKMPTIWDFHVSDKVISPVVRRSHAVKTTRAC